jgi:poly-gamma-glutamate synthesis protein (capsule biosynthesis protein)
VEFRHRAHIQVAIAAAALSVAACSSGAASTPRTTTHHSSTSTAPSATPTPTRPARPAGEFTINFAGDVHFSGRVAPRLAADPATVFAQAAPVIAHADLSMVNLETAITSGGDQQGKEFTFRAPASAFTALRDAGIDVATMANNHGADYGASGLADTFAAIKSSGFPVVGIGQNAAVAYAPFKATLNGVRIAIFAASQVADETMANFSAGPSSPGIASAFSPQLIAGVKAAKAHGYVVIVYLHWGTEYNNCPNYYQQSLAVTLSQAGATAVIGTHAHILQGDGWLPNGTFVAYGLGNYLWWRSFDNNYDDNGVLTVHFDRDKVVAAQFHPSRLDQRGVPVPASGADAARIMNEWTGDRGCTTLAGTPPSVP